MTEPRDPTRLVHPRRPFLLRLLGWGFALWSVLGWLRFIRACMERDLILELLPPALFWYLLVAGLIWGLTGIPILWGLARRAAWTPKLIWVAAGVFPALYWFERLVLWQDVSAQGNWPFMLVLTLLWLGLTVWALRTKQCRHYFNTYREG